MTTGYYHASKYQKQHSEILDKATLDLSSDDTAVLEGGRVVWNVEETISAARTLVLANFDQSRFGEYFQGRMGIVDPHIMIRVKADCSVNNVTITDAASSTLKVVSTDASSVPLYFIFRLTTTRAWELC